jgi:hypothetical protein
MSTRPHHPLDLHSLDLTRLGEVLRAILGSLAAIWKPEDTKAIAWEDGEETLRR